MILRHLECTDVDPYCRYVETPEQFSLELTLPIKLVSLNKYLNMHFHARSDYKTDLHMFIKHLLINKRPKKPATQAMITIKRFSPRFFDFDGLVGAAKPLVDALTRCEIITDDKWAVTGQWHVEQHKCKESDIRIELSVIGKVEHP